MKKTAAILLALLMLLLCACKGSDAPGTEASDPTAAPEATLEPTLEPSEEPSSEPGYSPEFEVMRLANLEYGTDYVSLYDEFGGEVTIADVAEDGEGFAHIVRGGEDYLLGLDFLSKAMVYNTEPAGEFLTPDEVSAEWWRYYILRWNYLLPEVPVYRNVYYLAYNDLIKGIEEEPVNPFWNSSDALPYWSSLKEDNSIDLGVMGGHTGCYRLPDVNAPYPSWVDVRINKLAVGLQPVARTKDGGYCWNDTVVKTHEQIQNTDGSLTFKVTIREGLRFSDGSPVTAEDYVAMPLVTLTNAFGNAVSLKEDARAFRPMFDFIPEDDPFRSLTAEGVQSGDKPEDHPCAWIRLLDELTFAVTVPAEQAPSFYAFACLNFGAEPHWAWLGDARVKDDGSGCYITGEFYKRGTAYRSEQLHKLIYDYDDEALSRYPWSGPYVPVSADEEHETPDGRRDPVYVLKRNPYFAGNYEGVLPTIETVRIHSEGEYLYLEAFEEGVFDTLEDITGAYDKERLEKLLDAGEGFSFVTYNRAGYGKIAFRGDLGAAQFGSVRRAVSYVLNRQIMDHIYNGGAGSVVYAPYSEDMWEYELSKDRGFDLIDYGQSLEKAIAELEADGWIYNEKGEPYEEGVRYKRIPGDVITQRDAQYAATIMYYDNDGAKCTAQYDVVNIGGDFYMPLVLNLLTSPATDAAVTFVDYIDVENGMIAGLGAALGFGMSDYAKMLDEFFERSEYVGYDGEPAYNVFIFATGFASPKYDHSKAFTLCPDEYDTASEYYLRDWADIFMLND